MSFKINLILVLFLMFNAVFGLSSKERARYDNYHVYNAAASTSKELTTLKNLEAASDSLLFVNGVHTVGKDVTVVVAPHKVPHFLEIMNINGIEWKLLERNFQRILDIENSGLATRKVSRGSNEVYDWTDYHQLDDTYKWLETLSSQYSGVVSLIKGGETYENRSILGVKISFDNGQKKKPGIFVEAGIHAREWIGPATATFVINKLLTSKDAGVRNIAKNYDWYIFPHTNPDGYVYTHKVDRLWRKTRKPYGVCIGADPNRNWDFHWNEIGASDNPCAFKYAGPAAFSEIETRTLSEYISSLKGKIQLYVALHSFTQSLMYPYSHTMELPKNHKDLKQVADAAVVALSKRYGTKYTTGNAHDTIDYFAAGTSADWAYGKADIKMSFIYELRPHMNKLKEFIAAIIGGTGFELPKDLIIPVGEETLDSIVAMVNEVQKLGYFNSTTW